MWAEIGQLREREKNSDFPGCFCPGRGRHLLDGLPEKETASTQRFGKARGGGGATLTPTSRGHPLGHCWSLVPPDAVGPSKSVIKLRLLCQIATSSWLTLKDQQTYITSAPSCSCCPSQNDHRKLRVPVGIRPVKRLAATQRASLSHPKAPGRTLPK